MNWNAHSSSYLMRNLAIDDDDDDDDDDDAITNIRLTVTSDGRHAVVKNTTNSYFSKDLATGMISNLFCVLTAICNVNTGSYAWRPCF